VTRIALDSQLQEQARVSAVDGKAISAAARAHAAAAAMCIQPAQDNLSYGDYDSTEPQGTVTRVIQSRSGRTCISALYLQCGLCLCRHQGAMQLSGVIMRFSLHPLYLA